MIDQVYEYYEYEYEREKKLCGGKHEVGRAV
jgi:hypothetical protein